MLKLLSQFITAQQLAKIITLSIFLLFAFMIWFLIQSSTHQHVELKSYKTLNTSILEKYQVYKRKLDDSPYLMISKNSEIKFAFYCDSFIQTICDNESINSGNKIIVEHAKIVTIKNYKFIQSLKTHDLSEPYDINYEVSPDQLISHYQQNNNGLTLTLFLVFFSIFGTIFAMSYGRLEEKIMIKLSKFAHHSK